MNALTFSPRLERRRGLLERVAPFFCAKPGATVKFKVTSAMLERALGIALPSRKRNLGVLADIVEKITAEPWFATEARDEFRDYVADRIVSADMDDKQKRSLLISVAQRYYSR